MKKVLLVLLVLFFATCVAKAQQPDDVVESSNQDVPAAIDENPSFLGQDASAFGAWVSKYLRYPALPRKYGIEGRVMVGFCIDVDGTVSDVKVVSGVDRDLDKEAVRVIASSPKWKPAIRDGKPVRTHVVFPVIFRLK